MMSVTLKRLDDDQSPADIRGVTQGVLVTLTPEMQGFSRVALPNLWLFGPLLQKQLEVSDSSNTMLRTATVLTVVQAGSKDNVLPGRAEATVNFRLPPGDTTASVTTHVEDAAKAAVSKGKFKLARLPGSSEASPVSPMQSVSYQLINKTVRELSPGTVVAPGLMIDTMDSRHMIEIVDHVYRFSPARARPEDLSCFHGTNERVIEANLMELIRPYHRLVWQAAGA